jgi:hypothetical protein
MSTRSIGKLQNTRRHVSVTAVRTLNLTWQRALCISCQLTWQLLCISCQLTWHMCISCQPTWQLLCINRQLTWQLYADCVSAVGRDDSYMLTVYQLSADMTVADRVSAVSWHDSYMLIISCQLTWLLTATKIEEALHFFWTHNFIPSDQKLFLEFLIPTH